MEMTNRIAVTLVAALLAACTSTGKEQNTVNEASTATGTGNTAGSFTAPGASTNSQGAKENARR
jgi:outer membrane biogenesis lipoprotein LolB